MSNPNPVKQTFATPKATPSTFKPRDLVAGEATPRVVTVMHPRNIYRPAKHNTDGLRVSL
jgi:hypothetical protein